jgi:hypothetical protein
MGGNRNQLFKVEKMSRLDMEKMSSWTFFSPGKFTYRG